MRQLLRVKRTLLIWLFAVLAVPALASEWLVIGMDEKIKWDEANGGKIYLAPPGKDQIAIFNIDQPERPRLASLFNAENSLIAPPSNVLVAKGGRIALMTNPLRFQSIGGNVQFTSDDSLYVIDLEGTPRIINTLKVGLNPWGMSQTADGSMVLIGNFAGKSITALGVAGKTVRVLGSLDMGEPISHVAITPDGKRAIALKPESGKAAMISVQPTGMLELTGVELPVGAYPINAVITPNAKFAIVVNGGNNIITDGSADTLSLIELDEAHPRVVDHIAVGDGPEGVAISPDGKYIAVAVHLGSNAASSDWYFNPRGVLNIFRVVRGKLVLVGVHKMGRFPEPIAFASDSRHLYVANVRDNTLEVLEIKDGEHRHDRDAEVRVTVERVIKLPGQPASMAAGR